MKLTEPQFNQVMQLIKKARLLPMSGLLMNIMIINRSAVILPITDGHKIRDFAYVFASDDIGQAICDASNSDEPLTEKALAKLTKGLDYEATGIELAEIKRIARKGFIVRQAKDSNFYSLTPKGLVLGCQLQLIITPNAKNRKHLERVIAHNSK